MLECAMVLAAGFGSRLGALTATKPKPLISVNGKAVIDIVLDRIFSTNSIKKAIVNTHYLKDMMRAHLASSKYHDRILISEEDKILGTGGGILHAMNRFSYAELLLHNSDILILKGGNIAIELIMKTWDPDRMDALLLLAPLGCQINKSLDQYADFLLSEDNHIIKAPNNSTNGYKYVGIAALSKKCMANISSTTFSITNILFQSQIETYRRYRFYGVVLPKDVLWCDIGSTDSLALTEDYLIHAI